MRTELSASRRPIPATSLLRILPFACIAALSLLIGLSASHPAYLLICLGCAALLVLGFLGEVAILGLLVISSAVSFAFLTGGERTLLIGGLGANLDALRLVAVLSGFFVVALRRPAVLDPIRMMPLYVAFLAYGALTLLWTPNLLMGIRLLCKLAYPLVAFALTVHVAGRLGEQVLEKVIVAAALAATCLNLIVALSGASLFSSGFENRYHGASHPNSIGLLSVFAALTLYSLWLRGRSKWYLLLIFALVVQAVATGSRTALVAGLAGFLIYSWLSRTRTRTVLVVAIAAAIWLAVPTLGERTSQGSADSGLAPAALGSGVNISGRMVLWTDAWSALMGDDKLLGRGLGTTDHFFSNNYSDISSIHNGYLLLLIDGGVIGLTLLLVFFTSMWIRLQARPMGMATAQTGWRVLALSLTGMFLLATMTESTVAGFEFATALLWVTYGLALGEGKPAHSEAQVSRSWWVRA